MRTDSRSKFPAALLMAVLVTPAAAQQEVRLPASTRHDASPLWEFFFTEGYRNQWETPITAPVLDIGRYAGGLEPFRTGGNQSKTLHFRGADGKRYVFRSVDKFPQRGLVRDLKDTPIGALIEDQTAALLPLSALAVESLLDAAGVLYNPSRVVVMPDDPRLGEFREEYAGLLGLMVERPDEGPDDTPGFGGFEKIVASDELLEKLDDNPKHRVHVSDYLTQRLVDFLVGDPDRGGDQWRWGEVEVGDGSLWRPISMDHDWAFMDADGRVIRAAGRVYPKMITIGRGFSSLDAYLIMTREFDRRVLVEMTRAQWDSVTTTLQARLTDDVIRRAVAELPEAYRADPGAYLVEALISRRERLPDIVDQYYRVVNQYADVHATFDSEAAEVLRHEDGSVTVRLFRDKDALSESGGRGPDFERRFDAADTREIRLYMHRGDDRVIIRGAATDAILVRVIGGPGDDEMSDEAGSIDGTIIYDGQGANRLSGGPQTRIHREPYEREIRDEGEPPPEDEDEEDGAQRAVPQWGRFADERGDTTQEEWVRRKAQAEGMKDYGAEWGFGPRAAYAEGAGIILGVGPMYTRHGFRRDPYALRLTADVLYSIAESGWGAELTLDNRRESSRLGFSAVARGTQFAAYRFYGFGNASPAPADPALTLVTRDEVVVAANVDWHLGQTSRISVGPIARWGEPRDIEAESPLGETMPFGSEALGQVGGRVELQLDGTGGRAVPRSGTMLLGGVSAYPAAWDLPETFAEAHGEGRVYLPLIGSSTLAFRAGGKMLWGDFPTHEAAFLGGAWSLRGYRFQRFAGDAAAYAGSEVRVPLGRITLLTGGRLGLIGLADAGRVWYDAAASADEAEDELHTAFGAGAWFETLGRAISVTWARGEEDRIYLRLGMPF